MSRSRSLVAALAALCVYCEIAAATSAEPPAQTLPTVAPDVAAAAGGELAAPHASTVNAVWVEHELNFVYFGQTTYYSCDGLEDKVRYVLRQAGAREEDLRVRVSCFETMNGGVEYMPRVTIRASMPTEATPELLQKLRDDPKRELVARVRGSEPEVELTQFPAVSKVVEFDGRRGRRVEDGDCELLEQMTRAVFKPLGLRELDGSRLHCMRSSVSVGSVMLRIETLQPAPTPDSAPAAAPKGTPPESAPKSTPSDDALPETPPPAAQ